MSKPVIEKSEQSMQKSTDTDALSFIATNANQDSLKITPPKRWFNVCVALLIALIGSCVGAVIGILIYHFAK